MSEIEIINGLEHRTFPAMSIGDTFTMEVPNRRPWWAFWRPRSVVKIFVVRSIVGWQ